MNKRKAKIQGRPTRSQAGVDLRAIGTRIRVLRGDSTQEDFSRAMAISQAQLSKYELGQSAPPLGFLMKLAKKFGKSVDWILTGQS